MKYPFQLPGDMFSNLPKKSDSSLSIELLIVVRRLFWPKISMTNPRNMETTIKTEAIGPVIMAIGCHWFVETSSIGAIIRRTETDEARGLIRTMFCKTGDTNDRANIAVKLYRQPVSKNEKGKRII